jgi:predicted permease
MSHAAGHSAFARLVAAILLRLYPVHVRRRFGDDMTKDFLDTYASRESLARRLRFIAGATADAVRSGIAERREARSDSFGNDLQPASRITMHGFLEDVRFGLRSLRRRPGFVAAVVVTLALGIGANTAVFSLIDAIFIRPVGVSDPASLIAVYQASSAKYPTGPNAYPVYRAYRGGSRMTAGIAGSMSNRTSVTGPAGMEVLLASVVSGNYFDLLGVKPFLGRLIADADDGAHGASPIIVISHALWQRWYGGNADVLGKVVKIDNHQFTIVGVAPPQFRGTSLANAPDLWAPMSMTTSMGFGTFFGPEMDTEIFRTHEFRWVSVFARLRPGVAAPAVEDELNRIIEPIPHVLTGGDPTAMKRPATVVPITRAAVITDRAELVHFVQLMLGVVVLTLLLACANVANLLLVRSSERAPELGVRTALGAGRARLARQLFLESVMLAAAGAAAGLLVAMGTVRALSAFSLPGAIAMSQLDLHLDARILAFTAVVGVGTALVFGLLPALRASSFDVAAFLRNDRGARSPALLRNLLVATQVALALILLVGATLFTRSLRAGLATDLGFDPRPLAAASVNLRMHGYKNPQAVAFYRDVLARLHARPELQHVAVAGHVPLAPVVGLPFTAADASTTEGAKGVILRMNPISNDYFATLSVPIVNGRGFNDIEGTGAGERVVVINEAAARAFWGDENPLGRMLGTRMLGPAPSRVVGVVKTTKYIALTDNAQPAIFFPLAQQPAFANEMSIVARSTAPASALRAIREELTALDPNVAIRRPRLVGEQIDEVLMPQRFGARLFTIFSLIAVVVAAVGVHGVVGYGVTLRRRELGIRIALGARTGHIYWTVLRGSLIAVAIGCAIGLGVAGLGSPTLAAFLYGIRPLDVAAFASATLALIVAAVAATVAPARRAARTDPVSSMRTD